MYISQVVVVTIVHEYYDIGRLPPVYRAHELGDGRSYYCIVLMGSWYTVYWSLLELWRTLPNTLLISHS